MGYVELKIGVFWIRIWGMLIL